MLNEKQKGKNIAGEINGDLKLNYKLNFNQGIGVFNLGQAITPYLDKYCTEKIDYDETLDLMYATYFFSEPYLDVFTDQSGIITSIRAEKYCYYNDENIIGMSTKELLSFFKQYPFSKERIYVSRENKDQVQLLFEFETIGIQAWTYRRRLKTIFCSYLLDDLV